jgi:hypothetical protein
MRRSLGSIGVLAGLLVATACHAPPREAPRWEWVDQEPVEDPVETAEAEANALAEAVAIRPDGEYEAPEHRDWAKVDPGLVDKPMLFGEGGSGSARRLVESAVRDGHRPLPELLRPDRLLSAYAPDLRAPQGHGALLHAEQVVAPWDPEVILLLVGIETAGEDKAPLRKIKVSTVWSWLAVDELRHVGDARDAWRRQDATPWTAVFDRLEPGATRVSMFEVKAYDWRPTTVHLLDNEQDADPPKMEMVETLGQVRLRFVDRYGIPSEMFGRIRARPQRLEDTSPAMRMAVATVSWARKLRGDPDLRRIRWRTIEAMVPDEGVAVEKRDALRDMIRLSKQL